MNQKVNRGQRTLMQSLLMSRDINGLDFLDDQTKCSLIICCMECNDEITRQMQEVKEIKL